MKPLAVTLGAAAALAFLWLGVEGRARAASTRDEDGTPPGPVLPPTLIPPTPHKRYWPVSVYRGVGSHFGDNRPPAKNDTRLRYHAGADVRAALGDDILAIDEGVVLHYVSGYDLGAGLQALAVRHPDADYIYAEIEAVAKPGQIVAAGDLIGRAKINNDKHVMLHLEAWKSGTVSTRFVPWIRDEPRPGNLLNIDEKLAQIAVGK